MLAFRVSAHIKVALLAMVTASCVGCGPGTPERVQVSGQVLIDGKPVPCGQIFFVPSGSRPSRAPIDSEGRFVLSSYSDKDGAAIGMHRIGVYANEQLDGNKTKWHAPKKYCDYNTSGLQKEVTGSTDDLVIELTWAGGAPFVEGDKSAPVGRESQQAN